LTRLPGDVDAANMAPHDAFEQVAKRAHMNAHVYDERAKQTDAASFQILPMVRRVPV
jgi:hypothetical protein